MKEAVCIEKTAAHFARSFNSTSFPTFNLSLSQEHITFGCFSLTLYVVYDIIFLVSYC